VDDEGITWLWASQRLEPLRRWAAGLARIGKNLLEKPAVTELPLNVLDLHGILKFNIASTRAGHWSRFGARSIQSKHTSIFYGMLHHPTYGKIFLAPSPHFVPLHPDDVGAKFLQKVGY
jgi:hypothetical protein